MENKDKIILGLSAVAAVLIGKKLYDDKQKKTERLERMKAQFGQEDRDYNARQEMMSMWRERNKDRDISAEQMGEARALFAGNLLPDASF